MSEWESLETAPKDGTVIELGFMRGQTIKSDGLGLWGVRSKDAPARKPSFCPLTGESFGGTAAELNAYADKPAWIRTDRLYLVPYPSHWRHAAIRRMKK